MALFQRRSAPNHQAAQAKYGRAKKKRDRRSRRLGRTSPQRRLWVENLEDRQLLTVVSLNPVKDNTLVENATGSRSNGAGDIFVGLNNDMNRIRRGLLAFDIAGNVPSGATINSVSLTMWANRTQVGDQTIELHKALADWGEAGSSGRGSGGNAELGDATWLHTFYDNQFWANAGGDFSPLASGAQLIGESGAAYSWGSTGQMVDDVQGWLDDPSANFGWVLVGDESQRSSKRFDSRESSNAARRPLLTIDYTEAAISPDVSLSDAAVVEGDAGTVGAQFDVTLSATSTQTVTVDFATADGTAVSGTDFDANSGTLTFAPGESVKTITVTVTGDQTVELDETFLVDLSNAQNATIVDSQGTGTISNDDSALLTITDVALTEGNSGNTGFDFHVTLDGDVDTGVMVDFNTADGTATTNDSDYIASTGTLSFAGTAGETQTITVQAVGDTEVETDEEFLVELLNVAASGRAVTLGDNQGIGTIINDDSSNLPVLTISDVVIPEGNNGSLTAQFDVQLSEPSLIPITVGFHTADDTATAGSDYVAQNGTLNFAPGDTLKTLSVTVNGDTEVEPDETFFVNPSNPIGAQIADSQAVGTILNDDNLETPTLSISDVTLEEGDDNTTNFVFIVTLNGNAPQGVTVDFSTANGSAVQWSAGNGDDDDSDDDDSDDPNDDRNDDHNGDRDDEDHGDEDDDRGDDRDGRDESGDDDEDDDRGSDRDDDEDSDRNDDGGRDDGNQNDDEDDRRDDESDDDGESDSARGTGDYLGTSGTLHFAGQDGESLTITVPVLGDRIVELDETFFVNLTSAIGAEIVDNQGIGTILNDDAGGDRRSHRWQNPRDKCDVSDDGFVSPSDVLSLIRFMNEHGAVDSPPEELADRAPYYDVSGDDRFAPRDALEIIQRLNGPQRPEGEAIEAETADREPEVGMVMLQQETALTVATPGLATSWAGPNNVRAAHGTASNSFEDRDSERLESTEPQYQSSSRSENPAPSENRLQAIPQLLDNDRVWRERDTILHAMAVGRRDLESVLDEFADDVDEIWQGRPWIR